MDSTKTPVSNTFIRSPLPNQQQQIYFQHQKPPQSFRLDSLAPFSTLQQQQFAISKQQSLQRKQQPLLENVAPLLQHNNIRKNLFVPNTTQSINQHHNSSQALAERFVCRNSPPPSREQLDLDKNHKKHHPQIWCGKGQTEPTVSKHVYNYAQRKSSSEKTPMCRVAELTRYNKLRHGYVLLDESGPAHKKKFTVKLVLCPGQEFEGSGPSIKKAQQAAAQCALDSSTLPRPPPIIGGSRRHTRKDEPFNAILLLNSVAAQLGIFVNYKEELIRHPMPSFKSSLLNPAHLSWNTPFCSISNNNKLAPFSTMQPNTLNIADSQCFAPPPNLFTDTTFSNPLTNAIPTQKQIVPTSKSLSSILDLSIMPLVNASPVEADVSFRKMPNASINSLPLFGYRCFSFLPSSFLSLPSSILFNGIGRTNGQNFGPTALNSILYQQQQQGFTYKVTVSLSWDSSEHFGFGLQLAIAKQKAAVQALAHLRPVLECYKRSNELDGNFDGSPKHSGKSNKFNSQQTNLRIPYASPHFKKGLTELDSIDNSRSSTSGSAEDEIGSNDSNFSPALNFLLNGYYDEEQQTYDKKVDKEQLNKENTHEDKISQYAQMSEQRSFRSRRKIKSVVSQIHECALRLRMNVEFEVLAETGEPHNRVYTLRCRLISPSTTTSTTNDSAICKEYASEGKGPSKKAAKQAACYHLLEKVRPLLDKDPIFLASQIIRQAGAAVENHRRDATLRDGNGKEFIKRKTIVKDKKMDPEYVMQIRQEREPTFHFVSEQGQNRHKEFAVSVHCLGLEEQGIGPNKKLAKRAAAEAMLARIGYVKSMPQPGKSLLKKQLNSDHKTKSMLDQTYNSFLTNKWDEKANSFETFASVEEALQQIETKNGSNNNLSTDKNSFELNKTPSSEGKNNQSPTKEANSPLLSYTRRRVTFNEHVSACPPPEDSTYPAASIAPLKSELGGRIRRRNRDSQRALSQAENQELVKLSTQFLQWRNSVREKRGLVILDKDSIWTGSEGLEKIIEEIPEPLDSFRSPEILVDQQQHIFQMNHSSSIASSLPVSYVSPLLNAGFGVGFPNVEAQTLMSSPTSTSLSTSLCNNGDIVQTESEKQHKFGLMGAKAFLNHLSKNFKFTVSYSDFPRSKDAADEEQCFTLLTVGLSKPIVCHGSGPTEVYAHTDAAFNAIQALLKQLGESDKRCNSKAT
uniref:DRBM domain-containing protein n=1 Tax=Meloidogyne hapla TaxID=6305 RepID=A0A1I8B7L9_MELHA